MIKSKIAAIAKTWQNSTTQLQEQRERADRLKGILIRRLDLLRAQVDDEFLTLTQEKIDQTRSILRAADEGREDLLEGYGFNKRTAWFGDILKAMIDGRAPIEMQSIIATPERYLEGGTTTIKPFTLSDANKVNIELSLLVREMSQICPKALRPIITINDLRDITMQYKLTAQEQDHYAQVVLQTLTERGVINKEDKLGVEYNVDRYSRSTLRVDTLITRLRNSEYGAIRVDSQGNVYFMPDERLLSMNCATSPTRLWQVRATGILLRDAKGEPTDAALLAASFSDNLNRFITHVIALDSRFMNLQDHVFTILRAMEFVQGRRYHDFSFDPKITSPTVTAYVVARIFLIKLQKLLDNSSRFNTWDEMDFFEYAERNYGNGGQILPDDKDLITHVTRALKQLGLPLGGLSRVADIGSGPNFYPAMLLVPYVNPRAKLELIEYSPNRTYMQQIIDDTISSQHAAIWKKFEQYMVQVGGDHYADCEAKAKTLAVVRYGDIFDLPKEEYELLSSYFVTESIVDSLVPFYEALQSLAGAIKPGGIIVNSHTIGSNGWPAGRGKQFPAINVNPEQLRHAYSDVGLDILSFEVFGEQATEKFRSDYQGVAIVLATRK